MEVTAIKILKPDARIAFASAAIIFTIIDSGCAGHTPKADQSIPAATVAQHFSNGQTEHHEPRVDLMRKLHAMSIDQRRAYMKQHPEAIALLRP